MISRGNQARIRPGPAHAATHPASLGAPASADAAKRAAAVRAIFDAREGDLTLPRLRRAERAGLNADGRTMSGVVGKVLAREWAKLFDGNRWLATVAAREHYASMRKKYGLPSVPIA